MVFKGGAVNGGYIWHHGARTVELMLGDRSALAAMDISSEGFWRSFAGFFLSIPAFIFIYGITAHHETHNAPGWMFSPSIGIDFALELLLWLVPMLAYIVVLNTIGRGRLIAQTVIARNWVLLPINYAMCVVFLPNVFVETDGMVSAIVTMLVIVLVIVGLVNLTRLVLECPSLVAFALVMAELWFGQIALSALGGF